MCITEDAQHGAELCRTDRGIHLAIILGRLTAGIGHIDATVIIVIHAVLALGRSRGFVGAADTGATRIGRTIHQAVAIIIETVAALRHVGYRADEA